ncbi:hypothetical protein VP01_1021g2 [Puccinia sorghi]|uniref:Uncharacterized protein n=1 Tax=Puccinia sorghi TaxID=27349 RepID=A0A0L6VUW1_9BASI|nr:hypothetical protein VP01_1021g2 [Puccinia sorghi]
MGRHKHPHQKPSVLGWTERGLQDHNRSYQTLASIYSTPSELFGSKHWMSMPSMGEAMANAFESAVFFSSQSYSQLCFPHFFCPKASPKIYIGLLPKKHRFVVYNTVV